MAGDSRGITYFLAAQLNAQLSLHPGYLNCLEFLVQKKKAYMVTQNDPTIKQMGDFPL